MTSLLRETGKLSEEMRKQNASASEWMEFYEKLFEEKHPVKGSPLPIDKTNEEQAKKDKN